MKLKNILIVVSDIKASKEFYQELFGLRVVTDFGENVILTEGLVLQEKQSWENLTGKKVEIYSNNTELYFEESDMDGFLEKLQQSKWEVEYVNECKENSLGQRVVRFYDPDKHMIEVKETVKISMC